jgi:hypothetical protein|nr:MAG TPA: hypothetical protein [Caudoviricetes sp.]
MIDDKKIEAAEEEIYEDRFLLNGEEIVFNNDEKEEMFYDGDIKEAIGLGAKWMQEEFLKDLWHQTDEEPEGYDEWILLHYRVGNYYSLAQVKEFKSWKGFVERAPIEEWLYIDDLLPKEGGEQ